MNLPEQPEVKGDSAKLLRWINTILISAGGVVAVAFWTDYRDGYKERGEQMREMFQSIAEVQLEVGKVNYSRFTSNDWIKAKEAIDSTTNDLSRRVSRVEDGLEAIKEGQKQQKETLARIESKLSLVKGS